MITGEEGLWFALALYVYGRAPGAVVWILGIVAWWIASHRAALRGKRLWVLAGALAALAPSLLRFREAPGHIPQLAAPIEMVPLAVLLYAGAGIVALAAAWVRTRAEALAAGVGAAIGWVSVRLLLLGFVLATSPEDLLEVPVLASRVPVWLLAPSLSGLVLGVVGGIVGYRLHRRRRVPVSD